MQGAAAILPKAIFGNILRYTIIFDGIDFRQILFQTLTLFGFLFSPKNMKVINECRPFGKPKTHAFGLVLW